MMRYYIERLNRTVELDDRLVRIYTEYERLRDQPFSIVVRCKYGHAPSTDEVSDEELSVFCNQILLSELKALSIIPRMQGYFNEHESDYIELAKNGILKEFPI